MSDLYHKKSVRQLPPGKLSNIKKIFEDGENSSANKGDKQVPPARPPPPPTRVKSPVRQQPAQQQSKLPAIEQQQQAFAMQATKQVSHLKNQISTNKQHAGDVDKTNSASNAADHLQRMKDVKKLSPAITGRFTTSSDNCQPSHADGKVLEKVASFTSADQRPRPALRRSVEDNDGDESVILDNPLYSSVQEREKFSSDVSDMYAKVNKPTKDVNSPKKVTFSPGDKIEGNIPRREAIRKTTVQRRKTIAGCETESEETESDGVNVAQRTKLFDVSVGDKPNLPQKPDSGRRKFSLGNQKDLEEQQQNQFQAVGKTDNLYDPPWDLTKRNVLEKLKKTYLPPELPAGSSGKGDSSNNIAKSVAPPKSSILKETWKNTDLSQKSANKDNELAILRNQLKTKTSESAPESPPQRKIAPPPKPPRTHAHDDYMRVKVSVSQNFDAKPATHVPNQAAVRKTVHIMDVPKGGEVQEGNGYLSVKDRISKMQQKADCVPSEQLPLPSVSFPSRNPEQTIVMRSSAPSRPPPPKRRPNSFDHQQISSALSESAHPEDDDSGPVIIPVSPSGHLPLGKAFSNLPGLLSRRPNDKLPPEPDLSKQSQRFPLRKSYSSECLHSSRGSSLNGDLNDDEGWGGMSRSSYESQYEAVIDPDGYAVPNVFMRLPRKKDHSVKDENLNASPSHFLTRFKGCGGDALPKDNDTAPGGRVIPAQEQSLEKVNKKKMTMVKQKINQAYADVNITAARLSESHDADWLVVNPKDVEETAIEPMVLKKRIEYCTSVRLRSNKSIRHGKDYLNAIYPQLFEYCLVVGLQTLVDASGYEPYVMHKFPENVSSNLSVPNFCFPDATIFKPGSTTSLSESYSFVMTSSDGSRVYGYCRRIQPVDSSLPEVICVISPIDAFNMYNTLLDEIEARRRISFDLALELIAASFGRPLPRPGKVCHVRTLRRKDALAAAKCTDIKGEMETIFLNRSTDSKLENVNYESPLHYLGTERLVKVFSSMLMERRIILCSSNLSVLTQTVHALSALLYPFQWQHVYIPLLPHEMLDVLCAPVPFIVGVLSAFLPKVLTLELEEVFIVDLDKKNIVKCPGDESTILPKRVQKALKTAINMCKIDAEARNAQWLMVAEAFLRMFIETVGHFNNHIRTQQDGNRLFQKEGFIQEIASKEVREFLSWFTETQMFEVFITNHLEKSDYGTSDLFLQRLTEYKESKEESSRNKGLGAKVKNFGKALKTKFQAS